MVALAEPAVKEKRKMPVSTGRPKGYKWFSTPLPARARVHSLYVVQGLEPSQIAPKLAKEFPGLNLDPGQISSLCTREGWTKEKRAIKEKIIEDSIARTKEQVDEVVAATAILAEEGSISGLMRAVECTTKKSKFAAKDFASWAAGARQLVAIARQARGLESSDNAKGDTNNIVFIGQLVTATQASAPAAQPSEKRVEPSAPPVTQVASEA